MHTNNTELAIEQRGRIVARYSVPTSIPANGIPNDELPKAIVSALIKKKQKVMIIETTNGDADDDDEL